MRIQPVIGFRDGWMIIGSNAGAVERVFAARAGEAKTIADTELFNGGHTTHLDMLQKLLLTGLPSLLCADLKTLSKRASYYEMRVGKATSLRRLNAMRL